ncbi:MAG: hypothetical protein DI539_20390 [Flavobacterium psychrophilum]|nr:MAG: hypothetical protein DI539_20390 [Flavobacterium psychrophilum]
MIEKYVTALEAIDCKITSHYDLITWQQNVLNIIVRIYGNNSKQEESIKQIQFKTYASWGSSNGSSGGGGNNATHCTKQAENFIKGLISDLNTFGLPEIEKVNKYHHTNITLNQNQNQNQSQTVNINLIWESIKEELTGKQAREIEEIINNPEDESEVKKIKVLDKIKSFGLDVASNIVAGLLTNPAIYGM